MGSSAAAERSVGFPRTSRSSPSPRPPILRPQCLYHRSLPATQTRVAVGRPCKDARMEAKQMVQAALDRALSIQEPRVAAEVDRFRRSRACLLIVDSVVGDEGGQ